MDKMAVYNKLPVFAQNMACDYEGRRIKKKRYSRMFFKALEEYEKHDQWSYDQLCDYRDLKLQKMVQHCYNSVPYYHALFNEGGINPASIKTIDDLCILPIMTKEIVKENINSLVSTTIPRNQIKIHPTGGTTGSGLDFCTTDAEEAEQWAIWWRYRKRFGIELNTWCGNFGGKVTVPLSRTKPPYWRINKPGHQIFYSGYHLTKKTLSYFVNNIKENDIKWLHGYPSNLANFASDLLELKLQLPLYWVSIGAENLYGYQKKQMKDAFGVSPLQHYGLTEGVANISELPDGELVVDEDFSCVEFIPEEDDLNHIVGTTLTNYAMPLLRYDTGDYAQISKNGRHNNKGRLVESLQGRSNEYIVLPSGVKVGAAAISLILNKFEAIKATQFVQKIPGSVDVNILPCNYRFEINDKKLLTALHERLGNEIKINVHIVDSIQKTKNGKYRLVISEL